MTAERNNRQKFWLAGQRPLAGCHTTYTCTPLESLKCFQNYSIGPQKPPVTSRHGEEGGRGGGLASATRGAPTAFPIVLFAVAAIAVSINSSIDDDRLIVSRRTSDDGFPLKGFADRDRHAATREIENGRGLLEDRLSLLSVEFRVIPNATKLRVVPFVLLE